MKKLTDEHLCDSDPHACIVLQTVVSEERITAAVSILQGTVTKLYVAMVGNA